MKSLTMICFSLLLLLISGCSGNRSFGERLGVAIDALANGGVDSTAGAAFVVFASMATPEAVENCTYRNYSDPSTSSVPQPAISGSYIRENAYGLGVHSDQFGRPVRYQVMNDPAADTSLLTIKPDAYGLGVHSDQYGRPIKVVPYR